VIAGEELAADEAWTRLQELLRAAATQAVQPRQMATLYTRLRETLLKSEYQPYLPGFIVQCLTLDRYRDFIRLYHPDPAERILFLERAFKARASRSRDFLADADF
jgi:hypothetical protein